MTATQAEQKQLAIDTHSEQARLFADRYSAMSGGQYRDVFVYSRHMLDRWLNKLLPENGAGKRMLDLGCGTGYHMDNYKRRGFEMVGVDGSPEMLKQAKLLNPEIEFYKGDVTEIPLDDASVDYVLCVEVLRYLPDIDPCIREISRVLKPGGKALVTAAPPLQANLYPLVNKITSARRVGDLTHLKQFFHSAGKLRSSFEKAGFSTTDVHGVYGGSAAWLQRIVPVLVPPFLRMWEPIDVLTADAPVLKHFSNMFLVHAVKDGTVR